MKRFPDKVLDSLPVLIISAIILIVVFLGVDWGLGSWTQPELGHVVDRQYVPEKVTYTTETDADGNEETVRNVEPEKWIVIVVLRDESAAVETTRAIWNRAVKDATVYVSYRRGGLTNANYGYNIVNISGGGMSSGAGAGASF